MRLGTLTPARSLRYTTLVGCGVCGLVDVEFVVRSPPQQKCLPQSASCEGSLRQVARWTFFVWRVSDPCGEIKRRVQPVVRSDRRKGIRVSTSLSRRISSSAPQARPDADATVSSPFVQLGAHPATARALARQGIETPTPIRPRLSRRCWLVATSLASLGLALAKPSLSGCRSSSAWTPACVKCRR